MAETDPVRLIRHSVIEDCGSFEVLFSDGRRSEYFYWDDNAGRASITGKVSQAQALEQAKALARAEGANIMSLTLSGPEPCSGTKRPRSGSSTRTHCPLRTSQSCPVEPCLRVPSGYPDALPRGGQSSLAIGFS
jgi:hypothetical protein